MFAFAACALAPVRSRLPALPFRTNVLLGATLFAAPTALLVLAGPHGIGGWTPLLYSLMPLLLAIAGEGWTPATIAAPGAVLVLLNGTVPFGPAKLLWAATALAAVSLQAWSLRYAAAHLPRRAFSRALAVQFALAACFLGCLSFCFDPHPRTGGWTYMSFGALVALALFGTAVPYAGLFLLLRGAHFRPEQIAVSQWLQTLFAVGESAILIRAHPSAAVYAAGAALLVCVWSALQRRDAFST